MDGKHKNIKHSSRKSVNSRGMLSVRQLFESLSAVNLHFFDGEKTNFANFYY